MYQNFSNPDIASAADGNIFVSDQTFSRLFPKQLGGTSSHIHLQLKSKIKNKKC
jgi:hypothetical protein